MLSIEEFKILNNKIKNRIHKDIFDTDKLNNTNLSVIITCIKSYKKELEIDTAVLNKYIKLIEEVYTLNKILNGFKISDIFGIFDKINKNTFECQNNIYETKRENYKNLYKEAIDMRPDLVRNLDHEYYLLSCSKNKTEAGKIQKTIKDLEKQIEKSEKTGELYNTSKYFREFVYYFDKIDKVTPPNYIKFLSEKVSIEACDVYNDGRDSNLFSVRKLSKDELKKYQNKEVSYDGILVKNGNDKYIVNTYESECGKSYDLDYEIKLLFDFKKLTIFKSLVNTTGNEIKVVNNSNLNRKR